MFVFLRNRVLYLLVYLIFHNVVFAGSEPPLIMERLNGEIVFDGVPDESAWLNCKPFPMQMHSPVFGKEPQERSEVRLLFDNEFIYVGASFYMEDPANIMANSKKRDEIKLDCDWLGVIFDSYNDNENGQAFMTSPTGLRTDIAIFNDATGTLRYPPINRSWNTHWDVKSTQNHEGWFSEMRIPVSSLKFQEKDGEVVMGLILQRWIPYYNAIYTFPPIPNEYGDYGFYKVSMAQDVVFPGLKSRKPLYITPYASAGISQLNELNESETQYEYNRDYKLDAGLDLKYGITSNLTMDVTLNTDFAQVEADDEKVNLTRFNLFFEEKRQFFLERASIFDFNTGGSSTLFYSRRIGLDSEGQIVPILGGLRLIGRNNGWDMGFLNMQTMSSDSLPSENFGVLRIKKRVLNENSYAGGIYTSRIGLDGSFNQVYGLDALLRITGDEYLKVLYGQSFENDMANIPVSLDNSRYGISWQRRKNVGFYYDLFLLGSGPEFSPGIGFESRSDYNMYGALVNYAWLMPESSVILTHGPGIEYRDYFSMSRGIHESGKYEIGYNVLLKNNWEFRVELDYETEHVFDTFDFSDDAFIPAGQYATPQMDVSINTPVTRSFWIRFYGNTGGFYDGYMTSLHLTPSWSLSSSLMLSGEYRYSNVNLPVRDQKYIVHIARMKAMAMFSTRLSLSAFIQYNSDSHKVGSNIRFRYNPREGNDLWLVYNDRVNTDLNREIPYRPRMAGRTIMLKYTYTFRL